MSHAIRMDKSIVHLGALKKAAEACGPLEMNVMPGLTLGEDGRLYKDGQLYTGKGSMHYITWKDDHGGWVGDWPTPEGMKPDEVGDNAVAVIKIKGNNHDYQIGVVPKGDGTYTLCHDFYGSGRQIEQYVGRTVTGHGKTVTEAYGDLLQKYNATLTAINCEQAGVDCTFLTREQMIAAGLADESLPQDGSLYAVTDSQGQGVQIMEGGN